MDLKKIKDNYEAWKWLQSLKISAGTTLTITIISIGMVIGYYKYLKPANEKISYIPVLIEKVNNLDSLTKVIHGDMINKNDISGVAQFSQIKGISDTLNYLNNNIDLMNYKINVIYQSSPELQRSLRQFLEIINQQNNDQNSNLDKVKRNHQIQVKKIK
jgi:hypothetical protein